MIKLNNIFFSYHTDSGCLQIFQNFNFSLLPGERLGLTGANGAGKTTLLRLIMGLVKITPPNQGEVLVLGKPRVSETDFEEVRRRIGFVFQDADDQLFCPTVEEDIAFGPLNLGFSSSEAGVIVGEVLNKIGMPGYGPRVTYNLSGGEKKLVSLGTALAMQPEILILDEPTAGLDEHAEARIVRILNELALPCLIVSHDKNFLFATTERQIELPSPPPILAA